MKNIAKKHESKSQPGLFIWAEQDGPSTWIVFQQVKGFPATEACDDWFGNFNDADAVAKQLANE